MERKFSDGSLTSLAAAVAYIETGSFPPGALSKPDVGDESDLERSDSDSDDFVTAAAPDPKYKDDVSLKQIPLSIENVSKVSLGVSIAPNSNKSSDPRAFVEALASIPPCDILELPKAELSSVSVSTEDASISVSHDFLTIQSHESTSTQKLSKSAQPAAESSSDPIPFCTFALSSKNALLQHVYGCTTCGLTEDLGLAICEGLIMINIFEKICLLGCKERCHGDHQVNYIGLVRAYCDCGAGSGSTAQKMTVRSKFVKKKAVSKGCLAMAESQAAASRCAHLPLLMDREVNYFPMSCYFCSSPESSAVMLLSLTTLLEFGIAICLLCHFLLLFVRCW